MLSWEDYYKDEAPVKKEETNNQTIEQSTQINQSSSGSINQSIDQKL